MRDPDFTLAAGPTAATARTLAALGSPIIYHYDPVFLDAFRRTGPRSVSCSVRRTRSS